MADTGGWYTPDSNPDVSVHLNVDNPEAIFTVVGPQGTWSFHRGNMISFKGIDDPTYMVDFVGGEALYLLCSTTSKIVRVPYSAFWKSWPHMSIIHDCVTKTGWLIVK